MNKKIVILLLCSVVTLIVAATCIQESFVVKPQPKKQSANKVKEAIGSDLFKTAKSFAQLSQVSAEFQEAIIDDGSTLMQQPKNSYFNQEYDNFIVKLNNKIITCQQEIRHDLQTFKALKSKSKVL